MEGNGIAQLLNLSRLCRCPLQLLDDGLDEFMELFVQLDRIAQVVRKLPDIDPGCNRFHI